MLVNGEITTLTEQNINVDDDDENIINKLYMRKYMRRQRRKKRDRPK